MVKAKKEVQRLKLKIHGRVQGVFFRAWTQETAQKLGLTGWVRNLPDGNVEALAEGPKPVLENFLAQCYKGPPAAQVTNIESQWEQGNEEFLSFEIRYS